MNFLLGFLFGLAANQKIEPRPLPQHVHGRKCGMPEIWSPCEHVQIEAWPNCTVGIINIWRCDICRKNFRSAELP